MSRPVILLAVACCLLPAVASHAQNWKESPFHRQGFYAGLAGTYAFDQGLSNYLEDTFTELTDAWNARRGTDPSVPALTSPIKNNDVNASGSVGVNARVGYRMRPWFAGELQVEYVPPLYTEVEIENKTLGTTGTSAATQVAIVETMPSRHELVTATANARIFFPTGRVQPYMLGGMGFVYSQTTGDYLSHCVKGPRCLKPTNRNPPVDVGSGALENGLDFAFRAGGGVDLYLNEHFVLNWEATAVIPTGKLDKLNYYSFSWGVAYRF
jgi:opacity protein-like surface antigen